MEKSKIELSKESVIELLDIWPLPGALTVQPTNQGTVNTTFVVETQVGKFVLKLYNNNISTAQIQYEHSLLAHLQKLDLSFAVPTPVPTRLGETLVFVSQNNSLLRVALLPFISGEPADRNNPHDTYAVGQALGELHHALASFDSDGKFSHLPAWGNLPHLHPLVTDPFEVPHLLELPLTQQQRIIKTLTEVIEVAPKLYNTLPTQTTHADFLCPNVLLTENRVVGILDFEFATYDLRLIDYIAALDHFSRMPSKEAPRWEFIKAFSTGYAKHVYLSQLELEALTLVWRLQQASCIVYWTGWLREGKVTYQSVLDGVTKMLLLEDWLEDNVTKLLSYVV